MNTILSHFHTLFVNIKKYLKYFKALWTGWSKPNSSIDQIFAGPELFTWCTPPQCIEWISNRRKSNPSKIIATSKVINTWFWRYLQLWDPLVLMQILVLIQSMKSIHPKIFAVAKKDLDLFNFFSRFTTGSCAHCNLLPHVVKKISRFNIAQFLLIVQKTSSLYYIFDLEKN